MFHYAWEKWKKRKFIAARKTILFNNQRVLSGDFLLAGYVVYWPYTKEHHKRNITVEKINKQNCHDVINVGGTGGKKTEREKVSTDQMSQIRNCKCFRYSMTKGTPLCSKYGSVHSRLFASFKLLHTESTSTVNSYIGPS